MNILDFLFDWFIATTARGSLLILLILVLQVVLRRTISPQWRYALWLPALFVLVSPLLPQSRWSAENLRIAAFENRLNATSRESAAHRNLSDASGSGIESLAPRQASATRNSDADFPAGTFIGWRRIAAVAWIFGAAGFLVVSFIAYARSWRRILQQSVPPDGEIRTMLMSAAVACGLSNPPRLIVSHAVGSPAVTGLFRPTLLLPVGFPDELSHEEVQLVLRHELIHLKRLDLPANWLLCCIQAVHWCNPVVWLAVHRIRADREAACDAQVLGLSGNDSRAAYGHALLKMEGTLASSGWTLGFVGIFEREAGMRSRIRSIAGYRRANRANAFLAAALLCILCVVGATRAQEKSENTSPGSVAAAPNSTTADNAAAESKEYAAKEKVRRKLNDLVIPHLDLRESSVKFALTFLEKQSVDLDVSEPDEAQRGVRLMLKEEPKKLDAPAAQILPNPNETRITVSLKNIPIMEALRYVTGLSNLKFQITARGVEVATQFPLELITREWVLRPDSGFKGGDDPKGLLERGGVTFPEGAKASRSADGTKITVTNTPENIDLADQLFAQPKPKDAPEDPIRSKLRTLIIPRLELHDVTLAEAVDSLRKKSFELDTAEKDSGKRGVNIVIKSGLGVVANPPSGVATVPGLDPGRPAPAAAAANNAADPRVTLSLSRIPLGEALRYVASLSKKRISIEPYSVALVEKGAPDGPQITKEWKLTADMANALNLGAKEAVAAIQTRGISFPQGASAAWIPATLRLVVRNTQENLDLLDDLLDSLQGVPMPMAAQARAEALRIPTLNFNGATLTEAANLVRVKSAAADPEKKGVSIVLDLPPAFQTRRITVADHTRNGDTSVWDALREIAESAGLKITGEAEAIRIHQSGDYKAEK